MSVSAVGCPVWVVQRRSGARSRRRTAVIQVGWPDTSRSWLPAVGHDRVFTNGRFEAAWFAVSRWIAHPSRPDALGDALRAISCAASYNRLLIGDVFFGDTHGAHSDLDPRRAATDGATFKSSPIR